MENEAYARDILSQVKTQLHWGTEEQAVAILAKALVGNERARRMRIALLCEWKVRKVELATGSPLPPKRLEEHCDSIKGVLLGDERLETADTPAQREWTADELRALGVYPGPEDGGKKCG